MKLDNQDVKASNIFTRFKESVYSFVTPVIENIRRFTTVQGQPTQNQEIKSRTISNTAQQRTLPSYDYVIFKDSTSRSTFFANLHANNPDAKIAVISKMSDFSDLGLENNITLEENNFTSEKGILFSQDPQDELILVIENPNIQANERVELNQLFDKNARISEKKLGNNINIISVVDYNIISGKNKTQQDFGRRAIRGIDRLGEEKLAQTNQEFFEEIFTDDPAIKIKSTSSKIDNKLIINLANKNWRQELFGGPELDKNGKAILSKGKLAELKTNQTVILQNAPWKDNNFNNELRQALTRNYYITNKTKVDIPQNISWHRAELQPTDIPNFKQKFNLLKASADQNLESFGKTLIINDVLFDSYQEGIRINSKGMAVKEDMLANKIAEFDSIIISSALTDSQWKGLLYHLEDLGKTDFPIIQYDFEDQPLIWQAEQTTKDVNICFPTVETQKQINIITDSIYFSKKNTDINDKTVIELFPDTDPENVSYDVKIKNYQTREFHKTKKQLFNAIESGKDIVIVWPDKNPAFLKHMETMLANPPSFGDKHLKNDVKLTIVVSDNAKLDSSLWGMLPIEKDFSVPARETLKEYARSKYCDKLQDAELHNKMVDQLDILITSINATLEQNKLDSNKIVFDETVIDKVWIQAKQEMLVNNKKNLSVVEFKKAVNSVLLKEFRANVPMYRYFKYITRYYFYVEKKPYFDFSGLKDFTNRNIDKITPEFIETNMWELLECLPNLSYLAEEKLDIPQTKPAKSKWLIIRFFQAVFNIVVGFFVSAMNWLLHIVSYKKELPVDLHGMPETTLLSMVPNEKYYEVTNLLKAALVACSEEKNKQNLKLLLGVSDEAVQKANGYMENWQNIDINAEGTLRNLFYYANSFELQPTKLGTDDDIQAICHKYAIQIAKIKRSSNTIERKEKQIAKILEKLLPEDLLTGEIGEADKTVIINFILNDCDENSKEYKQLWVAWEARRDARLEMKFNIFSSMFLIGDSGVGKTKRVLDLIKKGKYFILSGSPNAGTDDFFGINVLETEGDSKKVTFERHPVLEWAEFRNNPENPDAPITLFIDEGTLLPDGFLEALIRGINSDFPHVSYNGRIIELTKNHKIVIAGNPKTEKYDNRNVSKVVTRLSATNYLKPLDEEFQYNYIARPKIEAIVERYGIKSTTANVDVADQINTRLSFLFKAYSKNLPNDYDITTRDLNESCTLLDTYLWILQERGVLQNTDISIEMLTPIIERIVNGAIGGRVESERWQLEAIKGIYKEKFTVDDSLDNGITVAFENEYDSIKADYTSKHQNNTVDFNNKAITKMSYALWVLMKKREKELKEQVAFTGRRYLEIMGDAGIGKDMIVDIFLRYYNNKYQDDKISTKIHNVGPKSWSSVIVPEANKAFQEGGISAMSEVNIIPSSIFEGEFNQLLACDNTTPGFATIGTKNFSHFTARYKPSTAAQSRTTLLYVDNFDSQDLMSIAQKQVSVDNAEKIVKLHSKITSLLEEYNLSLKPSLIQLDELIIYVKNNPSTSDTALLKEFEKIYSFYIKICSNFRHGFTARWKNFSKQIQQGNFEVDSSIILPDNYQQQLSHWLANKFGNYLPEATYVMRGTTEDRFEADKNYIFLSSNTLHKSFLQQQAQVFNVLIDNLWNSYGAPSIDEVDHKYSVLYKQWKQKFAAEKIYAENDNSYLNAELLFPISNKEQKILDSIDIVRKELLDSIYHSTPDRKNRAKAEIIFEGKKNSNFLTTLIDIASNDTTIFTKLLNSEQSDTAKHLLTEILKSDNLNIKDLQQLSQVFDSYPEQLMQIINYINQDNIEKYYQQRQSREGLKQLVTSLESHSIMQQQEFKNKINNIKNLIKIQETKLEKDESNTSDTADLPNVTITKELKKELVDGVNKSLAEYLSENKGSTKEGLFSSLATKAKNKALQAFVTNLTEKIPDGSIPLNFLLNTTISGASPFVKMIISYLNSKYESLATAPIPFTGSKYVVNDGITYESNQTPSIYFGGMDLQQINTPYFNKNIEKIIKKALGFFDQLKPKDQLTINAVEALQEESTTYRMSLNGWFTNLQIITLLGYDDYNVKRFILYYLSLVECKDYNIRFIIANELINSNLKIDKIFDFLNIIIGDIKHESFIVSRNKKICTLMHICGELLECCLNNLKQNKNIEKNEEILEKLLNFKFLNDNLSAKGANALAAIRKLNIQALNPKIDNFLQDRYQHTVTNKLNIGKPTTRLTLLDENSNFFTGDVFDTKYVYMYRAEHEDKENASTISKKRSQERREEKESLLKDLTQRTSTHMEEKAKKVIAFKSIQNWTPSNKLHLMNLIHGNAPFEHEQRDTKKIEGAFIPNLPIIINKDTMHTFYHKYTGTIINLGELLTSGEKPISDASIENFLVKYNLPVKYSDDTNSPSMSGEFKAIRALLEIPCQTANEIFYNSNDTLTRDERASDYFYPLTPEDISKSVYSKMLETFGSLTFCILASNKSYNGFVTVTTEDELQDVIDHHLTVENIHRVDFNGLQNSEFSEDTDEAILKMFEKVYGSNHAFFTTNDMQKVASEMLESIPNSVSLIDSEKFHLL